MKHVRQCDLPDVELAVISGPESEESGAELVLADRCVLCRQFGVDKVAQDALDRARQGRWKLVRKYGQDWELYAIDQDRAERNNLATRYPDVVEELADKYEQWARRCGVIPRERVLELYAERGTGLPES